MQQVLRKISFYSVSAISRIFSRLTIRGKNFLYFLSNLHRQHQIISSFYFSSRRNTPVKIIWRFGLFFSFFFFSKLYQHQRIDFLFSFDSIDDKNISKLSSIFPFKFTLAGKTIFFAWFSKPRKNLLLSYFFLLERKTQWRYINNFLF